MRDTSGDAATGVPWTLVRDAAVGAVRRGWPVAPGVYRMDALGFPELVPLEDTGDLTPIADPEHAQEIWTRLRPPGVLLVCGQGIDALEVPPWVSERLPALAEHGLRVPIATTVAPYRWLLLVATGSRRLRPELAAAAVLLHSTGEWAALPPTTLPGNPPCAGPNHPSRTAPCACPRPTRSNGSSSAPAAPDVPAVSRPQPGDGPLADADLSVRLRAAGSGGWDQPSSPQRGHQTGPRLPYSQRGFGLRRRKPGGPIRPAPPAAVGPPGHSP